MHFPQRRFDLGDSLNLLWLTYTAYIVTFIEENGTIKRNFWTVFFQLGAVMHIFFNKVLCNWRNDAVVEWITPLYTHIWSRVWAKSLLVVRRICNENKRVNAKPKAIFVNKRVQSNDRLIKRNMIFHNECEKKNPKRT